MTNIYFIADKQNNTVKIGRTNDIEQRLTNLQVGNTSPLELLYIIKDVPIVMEKHIHSICSRYWVRGEWFKSNVIQNHLMKIPYYKDNMKKYKKDWTDML